MVVLLSVLVAFGALTLFGIFNSDPDIDDPDPGEDPLRGTEGPDLLRGGGENNLLSGLGGDDTLFGGGGNDTANGGAGDDILYGDHGDDLLYGGAGDDVLRGGAGGDFLYGGPGDDLMRGREGDDFLYGGDGVDTLFGDDGDDFLVYEPPAGRGLSTGFAYGGAGEDTLSVIQPDGLTVTYTSDIDGNLGDGTATVAFTGIEHLMLSTGQPSVVDARATMGGVDVVGAGAATLTGGAGADRLVGGEGSVLRGGGGDDVLIGTHGSTMTGGAGNDTFHATRFFPEFGRAATVISDYQPGADSIILDVPYSPETGQPQVSIAPDAANNRVIVSVGTWQVLIVEGVTDLAPSALETRFVLHSGG